MAPRDYDLQQQLEVSKEHHKATMWQLRLQELAHSITLRDFAIHKLGAGHIFAHLTQALQVSTISTVQKIAEGASTQESDKPSAELTERIKTLVSQAMEVPSSDEEDTKSKKGKKGNFKKYISRKHRKPKWPEIPGDNGKKLPHPPTCVTKCKRHSGTCTDNCPFVHKNQEELYTDLIPHLTKMKPNIETLEKMPMPWGEE
ncbi:hypothetical protein P171DRAFT_437549 [Karstenula rhodostoma CBS 690.94]|uniref:Uncharacterized protein n=1 Tax=Karstenula rhodostoma CBS 690.94 TaxID=1392251 RepID=A0A9P4U5F2_9PLEO|nr:hypothetical protein P171DRAFT_437549 [Karstenula rhodostoma CBS 690.94]